MFAITRARRVSRARRVIGIAEIAEGQRSRKAVTLRLLARRRASGPARAGLRDPRMQAAVRHGAVCMRGLAALHRAKRGARQQPCMTA
jgi:hypothetical protein